MMLILESSPPWIPGLTSALERLGVEVELDRQTPRTDMRAVRASVATHRPSAVVLSGFAMDPHGGEPEQAFAQNAEAAINVAAACMEFDATAVLLSTAEVFGQSGGPFSESDEPIPASPWAESRRKGEVFLQRAARDRALILRLGELVEVQAGRYAAGLREEADDERVSPLHTEHLAQVIVDLLASEVRGIVHVASGGVPATRAGLLSFSAGGAPVDGRPGRSLGHLGDRAQNPVLLTAHLHDLRGRALPNWQEVRVDGSEDGKHVEASEVSACSLEIQTIGLDGVIAEDDKRKVRCLALGRSEEAKPFLEGCGQGTVAVVQGKVVIETEADDRVLRAGTYARIPNGKGGRLVALAASLVVIIEDSL